MADQSGQPVTNDPTTAQTPSQGGVFGGFVGVEDAATPKIPDVSLLFDDSVETPAPAEADTSAPVEGDTPVVAKLSKDFPTFSNTETEEAPANTVEPIIEEAKSSEEEAIPSPFKQEPITEEEPIVPESEPIVEVKPVHHSSHEEEPASIQEIQNIVEHIQDTVEDVQDRMKEVQDEVEKVEDKVEEIQKEVDEVQDTIEDEPTAHHMPHVSDIKAKYNELAGNIKALIAAHPGHESISIVGSNTDTSHVEYIFTEEEAIVEVTRNESDKRTGDTTDNTIAFISELEEGKIQVYLDDTLLFEEQELSEDPKKKMQVMEKLNKFIFLTEGKLKDVEKARKAMEAELQEKRRLQDIFRNF